MSEVLAVNPSYRDGARDAEPVDSVADPHLSVTATARALHISPATLRRYLKDYSEHLDVERKGRRYMIAVSSVPALAQIRDLRARKVNPEDIGRFLAAVPGQAALSGIPAPTKPGASATPIKDLEKAVRDLKTELISVKRTSRDSEVVVRQSLANILFLIEKFGKEQQYHASEERIANIERDLLLMQSRLAPKELPKPQREKKTNWLVTAVTRLYRRLSTTFL